MKKLKFEDLNSCCDFESPAFENIPMSLSASRDPSFNLPEVEPCSWDFHKAYSNVLPDLTTTELDDKWIVLN